MRRNTPVLLILAFGTLASVPAPLGPSGEPFTIEELRGELEEFGYELAEAYYALDAYGEEVDTGPIYEKYAFLDDPALVDWLRSLEADAMDPLQRRSYAYLVKNLVDNLLWFPLEEIYYDYVATEASAVLVVGGEEIPYRQVDDVIFREDDRDRRRELWTAEREFIVGEINPRLAAVVEATRRECRELGFHDFVDYYAQINDRDFAELTGDCLYILGATRGLFETLARERAAEVFPDLALEEVRSYDRGQLWRTDAYDSYFPAERLVPLWLEFTDGLGIDFQSLGNILLDSEDRPEKQPRAACWPMRVPDDIRVLVKPSGGFSDYETLFHEMGHALHFAFTDPGLPYEFKLLGDDAVTETYAFVLENVFENPSFLREAVGMTDEEETRRFRREQLYFEVSGLRSYCVSFLYELTLHGVEADPRLSYKELIDWAGVWTRTDEEYDTGVYYANEDFYTTNYLYAWLLESLVRETLTDRLGGEWWRDPAAGDFLEGLWSRGYEATPGEIAAELGYAEISPVPLVERLMEEEEATRPGA
ncbi:MAG: hypothetical protein A2Y64_07775 [Candidatus Coatesbacteria bacterium RBG_13_66_14]|uniref:Uncharacterized protein n=1 Tax=Candidatus Coatesbacteria bacterium RBG_13_66_14 TaxID=1817816 RepID=A0A1F5FB08_9BACT|nr:MAG: hypothetical protein A2Y64_07775 [Candidatus Coatesbacteria bacterium RBG_13_66_14]